MKNRKRVVSLVLGLVLMVGGIIGPFTVGSVANEGDGKSISASLTPLDNEDVNLKDLRIKGELEGDLTEELKDSTVVLTFIDKGNETDKTKAEKIELKGALVVNVTPIQEEEPGDSEEEQGQDPTEEEQGQDPTEEQDHESHEEESQTEGSEQQKQQGETTQSIITAEFTAKINERDIKDIHKDITFKLEKIELEKNGSRSVINNPAGEFKFKVVDTGISEGEGNEGDTGNTDPEEENTPQITIKNVKFFNDTTETECEEKKSFRFSFEVESKNVVGDVVPTTKVNRFIANGVLSETPTELHIEISKDNNKYIGIGTAPSASVEGNDYNIEITVTQGDASETLTNALTLKVTPEKKDTATVDLQLERILSSSGQISNDSGQVFREGSSITYTIRSKNTDVTFTSENITAVVTKKDGSVVGTTLNLARSRTGNYTNREYAVTFTAQAPLDAGDSYTITTVSIPYSLKSGETGTIPAGSVSYKTETNKPYIAAGGLKASYTSSPQSNNPVSQSALIAGNVVNLEADLTNGAGVYSVTVDYVNTQGTAGKNFSITLKKDGATGKYKGSYTITDNNVGYTYNYRQATYKTSENASSQELKNNNSVSALSFTVGTHQHRYGTAFSYDDKTHWNNSACNDEHPNQTFRGNEAAHTFRSSVTNSASQTTPGTMTYTCTVCGYRYNATIPQSGTVLSTTILDNLAKVANGSRVAIVYSNDYVVSTDVFNALKGTTKELELINENGVTWIFKGADITGTIKPININASISTIQSNTGVNAAAIKRLVKTQPTIVIDFPENGDLPGKATVRVPLNTAMLNNLGSRENIKVQYYNPAENRLENIATIAKIPDGNYIEFAITHNSSYIITKEAVGANGDNDKENTGGNANNNNANTNGGTTNNTNNSSSGNKTPTTTTTTTVIHRVSPKTFDGGYGILWVAMFMVGVLLVVSSLCMTKFEE